jgi:hypothetical protein
LAGLPRRRIGGRFGAGFLGILGFLFGLSWPDATNLAHNRSCARWTISPRMFVVSLYLGRRLTLFLRTAAL